MSKTILYYYGKKYTPTDKQDNYIKTFDWNEDEYNLDRCTAEVICRTYIDKEDLHGITTKTINIEPIKLKQELDKLKKDGIQQNFSSIFKGIKDYISQNCIKVSIDIEEANTVSSQRLHEIAGNEAEREKFINRLFEILAIIHRNNLVHRDIKIENLMYVTRNNEELLVLNDWDASFILQNDLTEGMRYVLPIATPEYASPEQCDQNMRIGMHTDVWQAGMVAYYLHNDRKFPSSYSKIDFEKGDSVGIRAAMNSVFKEFKRKKDCTFPKPKNSNEYIGYIISSALNVNPEQRPTVEEIIRKLTEIRTQPVKPEIPEYENPDINPVERAKKNSKSDEEAAIKEKEKEKRKKNLKRIIVVIAGSLGLLLCVAVGSPFIDRLNSRTDKTEDTESDSAVSEDVSQTKDENQATEDKTSYVTETEQATATQNDSTEISIDEEINSFDYTYVEWVENYRLGDGTYTGGLDENGYVHGKDCTYEKDNGEIYKGDYYHGKRYGYGFYKNDQLTYKGNWINDMMYDDDCHIDYSNGNSYWGGIKKNKKNGKGIFYVDKENERGYLGTYNGSFVDDNFEGDGTFQYSNGDVFAGEFHEHEKWNGSIKYYANRLEVEIKNGQPEQ